MRTTVTLDTDVERMLRNAMHRSRKSFKRALNDAVRSGLRQELGPEKRKRFVVKARSVGLRTGIEADHLHFAARLADVAQGFRHADGSCLIHAKNSVHVIAETVQLGRPK